MGPSGTGKTTIGSRLAADLGRGFVDGDALHPAANLEKMAAGQPLDDRDRAPWLDAIGSALTAEPAVWARDGARRTSHLPTTTVDTVPSSQPTCFRFISVPRCVTPGRSLAAEYVSRSFAGGRPPRGGRP